MAGYQIEKLGDGRHRIMRVEPEAGRVLEYWIVGHGYPCESCGSAMEFGSRFEFLGELMRFTCERGHSCETAADEHAETEPPGRRGSDLT